VINRRLFRAVLRFTGSQNHRRVEVGRDIWSLSGATHLLKQYHLELTAQNHVWMTFDISKDENSTTS